MASYKHLEAGGGASLHFSASLGSFDFVVDKREEQRRGSNEYK